MGVSVLKGVKTASTQLYGAIGYGCSADIKKGAGMECNISLKYSSSGSITNTDKIVILSGVKYKSSIDATEILLDIRSGISYSPRISILESGVIINGALSFSPAIETQDFDSFRLNNGVKYSGSISVLPGELVSLNSNLKYSATLAPMIQRGADVISKISFSPSLTFEKEYLCRLNSSVKYGTSLIIDNGIESGDTKCLLSFDDISSDRWC